MKIAVVADTTQFLEYVGKVTPEARSLRAALKIADSLIPDQEISKLDLEPIVVKIRIEKEWSVEKILQHYLFYKQFLYLCKVNKGVPIVPTVDVDEFWHYHIQDTKKYESDCAVLFGETLHHFPYFGIRSKKDAANLLVAAEKTRKLLKSSFGIPIWLSEKNAICSDATCNSGGGGGAACSACSSGGKGKRPTLKTISWN